MKRTIERLRAEFLEMPGLRLNVRQIQRLCGVDEAMSREVLDALVDVKFLRLNPDGTYARATDGHHPNPLQAHRQTGTPMIKRAS
jgi:hypothetical protein